MLKRDAGKTLLTSVKSCTQNHILVCKGTCGQWFIYDDENKVTNLLHVKAVG